VFVFCVSVLEEFVKSERGKNRSLSITYCLAGRLANDEDKVIVAEQLFTVHTGK